MFAREFFFFLQLFMNTLWFRTNSTCYSLSWARHTINDNYKDDFKVFLSLINKFAYLGKIWTGCCGLASGKKYLNTELRSRHCCWNDPLQAAVLLIERAVLKSEKPNINYQSGKKKDAPNIILGINHAYILQLYLFLKCINRNFSQNQC